MSERLQIMPELLDKYQASVFLQISPRSLEYKTAAGTIPGFVKIGSSARWSRTALQRWIDAGCPESFRKETQGDAKQETGLHSQTSNSTLPPRDGIV